MKTKTDNSGIPRANFIAVILATSSVLVFNVWFLKSLIIFNDGQPSVLRTAIIWLYDVGALGLGLVLICGKDRIVLNKKNILFKVISIILSLLVLEAMLQILTRTVPKVDDFISIKVIEQALPDDQFGKIPNPLFPGHDSNGFRNRKALSSADIVAIGDSFTYGTGVQAYQTWPFQLERTCGQSVYNMSFGGYGCIEGLMLLQRACKMKPSYAVFAMYDGNDLFDAYRAVYSRNLFPELKTMDAFWQQEIMKINQQGSLEEKVKKINFDGSTPIKLVNLLFVSGFN